MLTSLWPTAVPCGDTDLFKAGALQRDQSVCSHPPISLPMFDLTLRLTKPKATHSLAFTLGRLLEALLQQVDPQIKACLLQGRHALP